MGRFLTVHKFGDADAAGLGLRLRAMRGRDSLSELFHFRLFADLPQDKVSELSAGEILGKRVVFSLYQTETSPVFFSGIISTMSLGNVSKEYRRSCNFEVVPELWKLTETLDTRRHPSKTVTELVAAVLEERKLDVRLDNLVSPNEKRHPPRVNPVQYEETYFDFLVRHMKEEGIFFYHREHFTEVGEEVQGAQTLVLGHDSRGFYAAEQAVELKFQGMQNLSNVYDVRSWDRQFNFKPAKWTINDYDYQKANDFAMTREIQGGEKPFRKFKAHAGFYGKDYADQMLANLAENEDVCREYVLATSDCPALAPGCRFNLKGHPVPSENGEYIVTSVEHRAFDDLYGSGVETEYENRFTCVPADRVPTSCPHTAGNPSASWPKPEPEGRSAGAAFDSSTFADFENIATTRSTFSGSAGTLAAGIVAESAWVVDATGRHEDPATMGTVHARQNDESPRGIAEVLIKYTWETVSGEAGKSAWQAPAASNTATRWVRVAQLAAGKDWGTKFIPRVGEEVVVLYLDGEKKKPVIMGSLFNSASNTANMSDRTTETVKIVTGQGGSGPPAAAFTKDKPYGVADSPGTHDLVEGISTVRRAVPNLKDDDVSGIRTRSAATNDTAAEGKRFNEILFKDKRDQEELYMHAARDMNIDVENDMHIVVHGDVHEIVHGKYYRSVNTNHAEGPVNRSIVGGTSFDLDKVWEYKSIEGTGHPYKVKTEIYADSETSAKGDVKEVQWGTTDSYFLGNKWEMNISAAESLTLGFAMDIFVGGKMEFCAALSMTMCMAGLIEITGPSMKLEVNLGQQINKTKTSANFVDVAINESCLDVYKGKVRLTKDQLHIIKADVIVLDANLIVLDARQIIQKTDSTNFLT